LTVRTIKPSDELRERAEEILAAYDKWDAEHQKKPAGYKAAKRAYERAADIETGLEQQIDAIQATTIEGMIAKARCAEVYHFENGTVDFGVSVTKDLLALDTGAPAIVPADLAPLPFIRTSAIEAVERYRKADKAFDRRSLKLTEAREAAEEEHGHQPIALIHWRNYYIGGGEIERVRKEFLKFGKDDPAIIESEYRDAKRRYRSAVKAAKEWEKRAGVDDLSNSLEQARAEMSAARKGLGTVNIVSVDDAAAILKVIRANLKQFGELADWEKDALNNASKYLIQTAKVA
jgi:hypothetical protein